MSHHHTLVASFAKLLTVASETVREDSRDLHCSPQGLFLLQRKDGEAWEPISQQQHGVLSA